MPEFEIRPTMRFILIGYALVVTLLAAAFIWWALEQTTVSLGAVIAAVLLLAWPIARHLERQRVRCRLEGGQLRYESGLFTTTVKTIPVASIQDVTVRRSFAQRIWGIGDLRIETAGKSSALEIANVEDPQKSADQILDSVQRG
jgi:uncharacterized membrane protein YdbT with pleckstrin-like domain